MVTLDNSMTAPNLADAIREWLPAEYQGEWYISTNSISNEEFKKMWPNINPDCLYIGQLNGWGWILNIYQDRVEAFQDFPWGGEGTEKQPLMAADPDFFRKLDEIMECIIEYRNRERIQRRKEWL